MRQNGYDVKHYVKRERLVGIVERNTELYDHLYDLDYDAHLAKFDGRHLTLEQHILVRG